jgi:aspartyl/asparaginyl-tRNA synthetase
LKEKSLFKVAMICSIIGLAALFFVSEKIEVKEIDIGKITDSDVGKEVRVLGRVKRVSDTDKVMFLEVGQEKVEDISVVLFKEKKIDIEEGDYVELIGELDKYNGEYSIIANAVKIR